MVQDTKYLKLLNSLKALKAEHDTAIGLIHPYWARKPMNINKAIIENLTSSGDVVMDPFMGSGTTIFTALSLNRSAIGSDINPLSVFLVNSILDLKIDKKHLTEMLNHFLEDLSELLLPLYKVDSDTYIERERFQMSGNYEKGNFHLELIELVTKGIFKGKWSKRNVISSSGELKEVPIPDKYKKYIDYPINFNNILLLANSRIAIPKGANLSHFFTKKNIIAINFIMNYIDNQIELKYQNIFKLLISSSLPLLRLSDKKASSQWPYWRPRNYLTSRNPVIMLQRRINSLIEASEWLISNTPVYSRVKSLEEFNKNELNYLIFEKSIQNISIRSFGSVADLVLTDPPYSDQAPYLEYSALWAGILGFKITDSALTNEIVKSDAENRKMFNNQYVKNLNKGMEICCKLVKDNGYLVWFYQDYNLETWNELAKTLRICDMSILDIIPINKQRRSMKTVTSPGLTLDGDLICIFKKSKINRSSNNRDTMFDINDLKTKLLPYNRDLYKKYSIVIREALTQNYIGDLSKRYNNIRELLKDLD